jgi:hypothetical protein
MVGCVAGGSSFCVRLYVFPEFPVVISLTAGTIYLGNQTSPFAANSACHSASFLDKILNINMERPSVQPGTRTPTIPCCAMVESAKKVPPFCERRTPPPPELPMLSAHTDLQYAMTEPLPLLSMEEIPITSQNRLPSGPSTVRWAAASGRWTSPGPNRRRNTPAISLTSMEGDGDDDDDGDFPTAPIRKPAGEPGRPGRGGYTLDAVLLGWPTGQFDKLKACILYLPPCVVADWSSGNCP